MKYYTADGHCDFLYYAAIGRYNIDMPVPNQHITIDRLKQGNVKLQVFATWIDMKERARTPFEQFVQMARTYSRILSEHEDDLTVFDKDYAPEDNKIATLLTIEDLCCMDDDLNNIWLFKQLGVKAATLVWNHPNKLGCPALNKRDGGLTRLGFEAIAEMEKCGIIIDLAHLSDDGIDDVLSATKKPLLSSHTNARSVFFSKRSLCDEHIKEISKRGGVIGVNFYARQLSNGTATIQDVVDHIEHIAKVGGIGCVCIGSDFDGMTESAVELHSSADFGNLSDALISRGFSENDVKKIMYYNLADFYANNMA